MQVFLCTDQSTSSPMQKRNTNKLVSDLRWQALRMRHLILGCFPQSLVHSVPLKTLSSKSFAFKSRLVFLWPEIYIWQLTAEMTDELPANQQTGPDVGRWHKILNPTPPFCFQIRFFILTLNSSKFCMTGWHAVSRLLFYILIATRSRFASSDPDFIALAYQLRWWWVAWGGGGSSLNQLLL